MKLKVTRASRSSRAKTSNRPPSYRLRSKSVYQVISAAPDAAVIMDRKGAIVALNSNAERLFGYDTKDLIGKDIELLFPKLHQTVRKSSKGYYKNPKNLRLSSQVKLAGHSANNPVFLADIAMSPLPSEDCLWLAVRDVEMQDKVRGVRKESPRKLPAQDSYTRSLMEASRDPLVTIDLKGKITDANAASVKLIGLSREKLLGSNFATYFTEPEKAREGYEQAFARGFVANYPLTICDNDGLATEVLYNASVYRDSQGAACVLAAAREIEQVKSTPAYARGLMEASIDPLLTINQDGRITDVNEAAVRATGVPRQKLIGTDLSDYCTEPEKAIQGYKQVFAEGIVADLPLTIRHKKGSRTEVLCNVAVYKDDSENVLGALATLATVRDVNSLQRTSGYARSLAEASPDPLVAIKPDGTIADANEAFAKATGVLWDRLTDTHFADYFTEPGKAKEVYKLVFARGQVSDYPLTVRHADGKLISVLVNASVYGGRKEDVAGTVVAARLITPLKGVEARNQKIQAYTRSLIETSLDPLVTKGPDGQITDVNEATIQVTGVPREKLIGTHFPQYFTEPDKAEEAYQQAYQQGVVKNYPLAIRHTSGKVIDVLYNATLYKDESGEVQGVLAAARDITDLKLVEKELKKQQAYTRSLIEVSLDPMVAISPDGKITDVNEALVKATGVVREKLIGTDFSDYFTEPTRAREGYQQVFAKGFVSDFPLTIRHNFRDVLYNASVYRDEQGTVLGVFAAARDITALRKQESKIKTLNEELEQRIVELESFSYSVSHDLRAPLRGIDGFIAIFLAKYLDKVDGEGQRLLGNVRKNVTKMGSLIDELLTLSRVGIKDIQVTDIDMDVLVKTVLEELQEMKGRASVVVKSVLPARGDIALIKQVLVNLIANAIKYSARKAKPLIEMGCKRTGKDVEYYVKDNGVGFDMEYSNKLFGVFQRLHDPQEYPGIGVGLAIVKRIIIRHGGRVWAEGRVGEGATFYFSLMSLQDGK